MSTTETNTDSQNNTDLTFESFNLSEPLLRGLAKTGFIKPTAIQARSIPAALGDRDVLASAQTGTGKTAAFVLPALEKLLRPSKVNGRGPRALILTPTRELAGQVGEVITQLGRFSGLTFGTVVGGLPYPPQEKMLRRGVDILVATPGRLMDHMNRKLVEFSRLEMFILDEADRMLDMGFVNAVQKISASMPRTRQTMLFSATLEGQVQTIARKLLDNPERIELASARKQHLSITQHLHMAKTPEHKHSLLGHFLSDPEMTQTIIFTATKHGADRLAKRLKGHGLACAALHGNMRQNARLRTMDLLRNGKVQVLVATDVAARGLDVEGISHVINFDLPMVAEDYIHRIGRTGRNGASGTAISLVGPGDGGKLGKIERLTGKRMERLQVQEMRVMPVVERRPGKPQDDLLAEIEQDERKSRKPRSKKPGGSNDRFAKKFGNKSGNSKGYTGGKSGQSENSESKPYAGRNKRPKKAVTAGEAGTPPKARGFGDDGARRPRRIKLNNGSQTQAAS